MAINPIVVDETFGGHPVGTMSVCTNCMAIHPVVFASRAKQIILQGISMESWPVVIKMYFSGPKCLASQHNAN